MGLQKFEIIFDNPHKVFYSGTCCSGKICIELDKAKQTDGVYVYLLGEASVCWSTYARTNRYGKYYYRTFQSRQTYVDQQMCVFRPDESRQRTEIPAGCHSYPFSFVLPASLPSSFEGKHGFVRYSCKAKINRPWRFDHKVKEIFTVNAIVDLNADPSVRCPTSLEDSTRRSFLCWWLKGRVDMKVLMKKSGFVSGESIGMDVVIHNKTDATVSKVKASLIQVIEYTTDNHIKRDVNTLGEVKFHPVSPNSRKAWSNVELIIPSIPPTNLGGECSLINIGYCVSVAASVPSCIFSNPVKVRCGLKVGTIPLSQVTPSYSVMDPMHYGQVVFFPPDMMPSAPPSYSLLGLSAGSDSTMPAPSPLPHYDDIPPPSYEECVSGGQNVRDEDDDEEDTGSTRTFTPRYPIYELRNPP